MAILNTGLAKTSAGGYTIDYSCRFNNADDASLSKTWGGAPTSGQKYTVSVWIKLCKGEVFRYFTPIYSTGGGSDDYDLISIYDDNTDSGTNTFRIIWEEGGASDNRRSYRVFRDPSAWYHCVFAWDSTQGTAADKLKVYVNNELITSWRADISEGGDPASDQTFRWNANGETCSIGRRVLTAGAVFDGYMAEFHNIDGQQLTPSSFGEADEDYGHWKPIEYAGTYGDNGFYLDFADSADLGNDVSGNGNDFAANNLVASDQMLDTPTNNFATLNPLTPPQTDAIDLSEGNLSHNLTRYSYTSTMPLNNGSWYIELYTPADVNVLAGLTTELDVRTGYSSNSIFQFDSGGNVDSYNSIEDSDTYTGAVVDDIYGLAVNGTTGTCDVYQNNVKKIEISAISTTDDIFFFCDRSTTNSGRNVVNFGQDSSFAGNLTAQGNADGNGKGDFYYSPPSGYVALCTANLPTPAVIPSEHFNTIVYDDGAGAKTGVGFQPDLVWVKSRGSTYEHELTDSVRGATKAISSDSTAAETTDSTGLTAFGADGFTVGADTNYADTTGDGMVAWNWLAGSAVSGTTSGSGDDTDYTGSVNTDAGFSIIRYGGNDTDGHLIPHHLGVIPDAIFIKNLTLNSWNCFFPNVLGADAGLQLDNNGAEGGPFYSTHLSDEMPTSSVVQLGSGAQTNASNSLTPPQPYIMYSWKSIEGYSKVGYYTGNTDNDGSFIYTGFRPAFVLRKRTDSTSHWYLADNKRVGWNGSNSNYVSLPNATAAEADADRIDLLSNGFKNRTIDTEVNGTGADYIYLAFAETPFKYSNSR